MTDAEIEAAHAELDRQCDDARDRDKTTGEFMNQEIVERSGIVDLHEVAWHIQKRRELEELGLASMEIFLDKRDFSLTSVNRNLEEQKAFEDWTEWTHEEHLRFIREIEESPKSFIPIALLPDDYGGDGYLDGDCLQGKVEWLKEKAAARGISLEVVRG